MKKKFKKTAMNISVTVSERVSKNRYDVDEVNDFKKKFPIISNSLCDNLSSDIKQFFKI